MKTTFPCTSLVAILLSIAVPLRAASVLFDFETEAERTQVAPMSERGSGFSIAVTNRFAMSGDCAVSFFCRQYEEGMERWPAFELHPMLTDWTGYDRLVVEIVGLGETKGWLGLYLAGPEGPVNLGLGRTLSVLPQNDRLQWVVHLDRWPAAANQANVRRIHFWTQEPKSDMHLVIDRLVLLRPGEPLPAADGPAVARDLLPLVASGYEKKIADLRTDDALRSHARDYARFRRACLASGPLSPAMLLGSATSMEKVMPRDAFDAHPLTGDGLVVRLARNEVESVQLLVAPNGADLRNVRVRAEGDFAANIEVGVMGYVNVKEPPAYSEFCAMPTNGAPGYMRTPVPVRIGWWPDPILNFLDGVDIAGTDVQSFWVRVRCPGEHPAGTYHGALAVSADDVETVRIPFAVRVNDFTLGRTSALPLAISFVPFVNDLSGEDPAAVRAIRESPDAPVRMWRRHEAEWVDFLADYLLPYDDLYHGGHLPNLARYEQLQREGRLGLVNIGFWHPPRSASEKDMDEWRREWIPRLVRFREEARSRGVPDDRLYTYGCDEVGPERFAAMRAAVLEIKKALPGIPVFTTAYDNKYGVGSPLDVVDWFTPGVDKYDSAQAAVSRAAGHKVWWYRCMGSAPTIERAAIDERILMGAASAKYRPDGYLYWTIAVWNSKNCIRSGPFTDWNPVSFNVYHGDGSWVCVGPDGVPIPTIRLENFRDGLEDYAYAKLLEEKLQTRMKKGEGTMENGRDADVDPDSRSWVERARAALAVPREVLDTVTNYTDDPAAVYRWRDTMADLIEESK